MAAHLAIDWHALFVPQRPLLELVLRGTAMYFLLFLSLRFVLKRQTAALGISDLLVIVLIADAAQNGMVGKADSVTENGVVVLTILFWSYALDRAAEASPRIEKLLRPPPLELVRNGRMLRDNMHRESVTPEELLTQLREAGIESVAEVKVARLEGDGHISIIRGDAAPPPVNVRRGDPAGGG